MDLRKKKKNGMPQGTHTLQDNRDDFGPNSPLPTFLGKVTIILMVLQIILSDFPVL